MVHDENTMIEVHKILSAKALRNALKHGPVVLKSRLGVEPASGGAVSAQANSEEIWKFLTDYGSHPDVLHVIAAEKLLKRNGHHAEVRMKFGAHVSFIKIGVDLTMHVMEHPGRRIDFELKDGSSQKFRGYWGLMADGHGSSIVTFGLGGEVRYLGWPVRALLDRFPTLESGVLGAIVSAVLTDIERHFGGEQS
ncbi:MAG: hypothetical protein HYT87_14385 [Nitrospirae bacterium]|nr:hypothetical protein [Nitrospirota bacterium]